MHLFINVLAASAGSGPTYVRNVVPHYAQRNDVQATFLLRPELRERLGSYQNVSFVEREGPSSAGKRFLYEQRILPGLIRDSKANVLISAGNFALRGSPVPQILLSGNSLYTSPDFYRDLQVRHDYKLWLDTRIKAFFARRSVAWADVTVSPTSAFAQELHQWAGGRVRGIHHGFDRETFFGDATQLPAETAQKLAKTQGTLRLLFVSHYNYYRNFETLFRGVALLRQRLPECRVSLLLTCKLRSQDNPGEYGAESAAALVRQLGIDAEVVELGAIPYSQLHHVYRASDIYVSAAYAESFAHPLVEAMASGLPVVASDLAVHREVCGDGATYFSRFSPEEFSVRIGEISANPNQAAEISRNGLLQAERYSWARHVSELISLAGSL
ncbi:MAG TPA: glycosyltransferase [Terriglobales bacterium]|jgi:glycosyltransferase involved in cell wall biosynthesis|nr:glycosyltransferase [Terriglobales bacterium]